MLYIKTLSHITQHELNAAGYKAQDLALAAQNQFHIAPSFVIMSTAYDEIIRINNIRYKIDYVLGHAQLHIPQTLVNAYNSARKAMMEATLPAGLETELRELYESITTPIAIGDLVAANERPSVRIILSTNRIENPENNDTIIQNINAFEELLLAVREAWALIYHPGALRTRLQEHYPETKLKVAMIIQTMEENNITTHAYSCLPNDHHKVYLQVYAGAPDLRDKIVKDYYALGKNSMTILAQQVREQPALLLRNEQKELSLVEKKITGEKTNDRELQELARLTKKVERTLGTPVKVFFASTIDQHQLLWINRLGFDIIAENEEPKKEYKLKNENIINEEVITSQETPAVQNTIQDTIFEKIEELRTEQQEDIGQALDERKDTDFLLETTEEQHTTKEEQHTTKEDNENIITQNNDPATPQDKEQQNNDNINKDTPVDVQQGVAAKLLHASLCIVKQVIERKYRSNFSESVQLLTLAEMVNKLNEANVFSRSADGGLLLKAEEAAQNDGHLTAQEYAKTIEEVSFLMTYA